VIGVVIPYFQRKPGLLNRALCSVAAQAGGNPLRVYIVDDTSPIPAETELAGLNEDFKQNIVILHQPNSGPGIARNLALDTMPDDISCVAFLDSDDAWGKEHLNNVAAAIAVGADFYFADHQREEDAQCRFARCKYQPDGAVIAGTHDAVFWCDVRALCRAILVRSPVGTSTVAIRRSKIGATRFPTWLRAAGEDTIFWLDLLNGDLNTACGVTMEVAYGRGVSIFNHRSWGNVAALRTNLDEMQSQIHMLRHFVHDSALIAQRKARCRDLDLDFCGNLMGCIRRGQWPAALVFAYLRHRPGAWMHLPASAMRSMRQKIRSFTP
jgi:succinoglycan biosynthesis protein ExoW